jgi:hypothetical protein
MKRSTRITKSELETFRLCGRFVVLRFYFTPYKYITIFQNASLSAFHSLRHWRQSTFLTTSRWRSNLHLSRSSYIGMFLISLTQCLKRLYHDLYASKPEQLSLSNPFLLYCTSINHLYLQHYNHFVATIAPLTPWIQWHRLSVTPGHWA